MRNQHHRGDARQNSRLVEAAGEGMALAADDYPGAVGDGAGNVTLDLFDRTLIDERPLHDADLDAVADLEFGNPAGEPLDEGVVDSFLHEKPIGADTCLAHIAEFGRDRAGYRRLEISIVEDDERAFPPSSSPTFFTVEAACCIRSLPIGVEPVKLMNRTAGCEVITMPIATASPVTTLSAPLGKPARSASATSASAVSGVSGAGLITKCSPPPGPASICA